MRPQDFQQVSIRQSWEPRTCVEGGRKGNNLEGFFEKGDGAGSGEAIPEREVPPDGYGSGLQKKYHEVVKCVRVLTLAAMAPD